MHRKGRSKFEVGSAVTANTEVTQRAQRLLNMVIEFYSCPHMTMAHIKEILIFAVASVIRRVRRGQLEAIASSLWIGKLYPHL